MRWVLGVLSSTSGPESLDGCVMFEGLKDAGYRMNLAARSLRAEIATSLRQQGLDDNSYILLRALDAAAGEGRPAITTSEVATELLLPLEAVNDSADRLVRDGWAMQLDASKRLIALSDKGRSALPALTDMANWVNQRALNGFTDEESDQLLEYLRRVSENFR
jgi:DNA-binding MarR family transcriptional regulator